MGDAKIAMGTSFSCLVPLFFGNAKTLIVMVNVFFRINVTLVSMFLATVVTSSPYHFYVCLVSSVFV